MRRRLAPAEVLQRWANHAAAVGYRRSGSHHDARVRLRRYDDRARRCVRRAAFVHHATLRHGRCGALCRTFVVAPLM